MILPSIGRYVLISQRSTPTTISAMTTLISGMRFSPECVSLPEAALTSDRLMNNGGKSSAEGPSSSRSSLQPARLTAAVTVRTAAQMPLTQGPAGKGRQGQSVRNISQFSASTEQLGACNSLDNVKRVICVGVLSALPTRLTPIPAVESDSCTKHIIPCPKKSAFSRSSS